MDRNDPRNPRFEPSKLQSVLQTMAYHVGLVMTEPAPGKLRMGISGPTTQVVVEVTFEPSSHGPEEDSPLGPGVWDQTTVRLEGETQARWTGNRCGAQQAVAAFYAAVVADVAVAEADEAEAEKEAA